jgi:hypothetical protein
MLRVIWECEFYSRSECESIVVPFKLPFVISPITVFDPGRAEGAT